MQQQQQPALSKSRFKDLPWFSEIERINTINKAQPIKLTLVGAGGIGSWLSLFLARTGLNFDIYDFDAIEEHNLGGQAFMSAQIGMYKADAVEQVVSLFTDTPISTYVAKFEISFITSIYTFSCVDNMAVRRLLFEKWKAAAENYPEPTEPIFIDGRILAEDGQVYAVRWTDKAAIAEYEGKYLFSDDDAPAINCTAKATSHCGAQIAILMAGTFFNHLTNLKVKMDIREVPFKHEFHLQLMQFNQYGINEDVTGGVPISQTDSSSSDTLDSAELVVGTPSTSNESVQEGPTRELHTIIEQLRSS